MKRSSSSLSHTPPAPRDLAWKRSSPRTAAALPLPSSLPCPTGKQGAASPSAPIAFDKSNMWFPSPPRVLGNVVHPRWTTTREGSSSRKLCAAQCRGTPDWEPADRPPSTSPHGSIDAFPVHLQLQAEPLHWSPNATPEGRRQEFTTRHQQRSRPRQSPHPQPGARSNPAPALHRGTSAEQN